MDSYDFEDEPTDDKMIEDGERYREQALRLDTLIVPDKKLDILASNKPATIKHEAIFGSILTPFAICVRAAKPVRGLKEAVSEICLYVSKQPLEKPICPPEFFPFPHDRAIHKSMRHIWTHAWFYGTMTREGLKPLTTEDLLVHYPITEQVLANAVTLQNTCLIETKFGQKIVPILPPQIYFQALQTATATFWSQVHTLLVQRFDDPNSVKSWICQWPNMPIRPRTTTIGDQMVKAFRGSASDEDALMLLVAFVACIMEKTVSSLV
jgi:hypothetical protein